MGSHSQTRLKRPSSSYHKPVPIKRNSAPFSRPYSFLTGSKFLVREWTNYGLELFISWRISTKLAETLRGSHDRATRSASAFVSSRKESPGSSPAPTAWPDFLYCLCLLVFVFKVLNVRLTLFRPNLPISDPSRRQELPVFLLPLFWTLFTCPTLPSALGGLWRSIGRRSGCFLDRSLSSLQKSRLELQVPGCLGWKISPSFGSLSLVTLYPK